MGNIFKNDIPKWRLWEAIPFIIGIGTMFSGVIFDMRNVYSIAQTDFTLAIEVASAVFTGILGIFKVRVVVFYEVGDIGALNMNSMDMTMIIG